ncbi:hypothetical protein ACIHFE_30060 [Streptomyces sp. NPDC052396]|uniref:hypothetical protein n=1 Tax=Streptomyces sp. NPDC052396 TaxID=3365689 RepID=UPI0037CCCABD
MIGDMTGFQVAAGADGPWAGDAEERAADVKQALAGLRQIRRVTNTGRAEPEGVPAPWERLQPVRAVALVLEAAGLPPSAVGSDGRRLATGYCVRACGAVVRVEWLGPPGSGARYAQHDALQRCADALKRMGWQALEYRGARGQRWLEVEPPA